MVGKYRRALAAALAVVLVAGAAPASATVDHEIWDGLLRDHVRDGKVAYRAIARERDEFEAYLEQLGATDREALLSAGANEQMAFWINAYNAYTVKLILDNYPLSSIYDVTPLWRRALGESPFNLEFIPLGHLHPPAIPSRMLSLEDIEHGILRKHWREPRIHFAVVCASRGCPKLRAAAYSGDELDEQLDAVARIYLADTDKNRYDAGRHTLEVSSIFKWFREDFEHGQSLAAYITRFMPPDSAHALATDKRPPQIEFLDYDWSLNE